MLLGLYVEFARDSHAFTHQLTSWIRFHVNTVIRPTSLRFITKSNVTMLQNKASWEQVWLSLSLSVAVTKQMTIVLSYSQFSLIQSHRLSQTADKSKLSFWFQKIYFDISVL